MSESLAKTDHVDDGYWVVIEGASETKAGKRGTHCIYCGTVLQSESYELTLEEKNAIKKARSYLSWSGMSRSGLIHQLEFEGFSNEAATNAVDSLDVDWTGQAVKCAESYLSWSGMSRSGLIHQLEFEGFSTDEATNAIDSINVDWFEQAAKCAASYMSWSSMSRSGLVNQLEFEGFTAEQAEYGASSVGY